MSLFRVVWEEEGKTVKAPGISETTLKQCDHYYVAIDLQEVWDAIEDIRSDPEKRLIQVADCSVGVTVLRAAETQTGGPDNG